MTQPVTAGIVERIRRYRKLNGWSARRLADETGGAVSRDVIANLESGRKTTLDIEEFLAIALALRVPPTALFVDLERPFAAAPIGFAGSSARPLDDRASNAAYAQWLNERTGVPTTAAAARIAAVSQALGEYLAATDRAAAQTSAVAAQLDTPSDERTMDRLRNAQARMADLQLAVPDRTD